MQLCSIQRPWDAVESCVKSLWVDLESKWHLEYCSSWMSLHFIPAVFPCCVFDDLIDTLIASLLSDLRFETMFLSWTLVPFIVHFIHDVPTKYFSFVNTMMLCRRHPTVPLFSPIRLHQLLVQVLVISSLDYSKQTLRTNHCKHIQNAAVHLVSNLPNLL